MDLSKLQIKVPRRNRETEPNALFGGLTLRGNIENIWAPQAEALTAWHTHRLASDVAIEMNTGGGKTLVGLLIALSLVQETQGYVLYVCPTNQLVEQTAERAKECGIEVATYHSGRWTDREVYDRCTGPCITNYAAVFNGLSVFRNENIQALLFDDAHVAGDTIRDQFTLRIPIDHAAFQPIANLFRSYFTRNHQGSQFENATQGDKLVLLYVPMFEVAQQRDRLRQELEKHKFSTDKPWPWAHLNNHLHCCVVLLSGAGIEITPPLVPTGALSYFNKDTRRVYMTATLPLQTEFLRTFGVVPTHRITPGGKSGEAQRQFLFMSGETDAIQREGAQALIADKKSCIITPSAHAGQEWCPPATRFESTQGNAAIQAFARSKGTDQLLLAGRFDGIDLPGSACRVLVLDGLPEAVSLLERFLDQSLRVERLRSAHTAIRLVQGMGRIFRSNTDHGAVIVCSGELQRWLGKPDHQRYLPRLLQQQVLLGFELQKLIEAKQVTASNLLQGVLSGDRGWDELYRSHVSAFDTVEAITEPMWLRDLVVSEAEAFLKLWEGNYQAANTSYATLADDADALEKSLGAWYRHWQGLAAALAGDKAAAAAAFVLAASVRTELGRPTTEAGILMPSERVKPSVQADAITILLRTKRGQIDRLLTGIELSLQYGPETKGLEQALCDLGMLLGLQASRPDNQHKTGPDVLWLLSSEKSGIALEAKTDKQINGQYRKKDDIGQFHDHVQWLTNHAPSHQLYLGIVGRLLPVTADANPPDTLRVLPLEGFQELTERIRRFYTLLLSISGEGVAETAEQNLRVLGLLWPNCVEALPGRLASDLKHEVRSPVPESM